MTKVEFDTIRLLVQMIRKDVVNSIVEELTSSNKQCTDIILNNRVRKWFWDVGIQDISLEDNKFTLQVNRPNKFIGTSNYLFELKKRLKSLGFDFDLIKAEETVVYQLFFNDDLEFDHLLEDEEVQVPIIPENPEQLDLPFESINTELTPDGGYDFTKGHHIPEEVTEEDYYPNPSEESIDESPVQFRMKYNTFTREPDPKPGERTDIVDDAVLQEAIRRNQMEIEARYQEKIDPAEYERANRAVSGRAMFNRGK